MSLVRQSIRYSTLISRIPLPQSISLIRCHKLIQQQRTFATGERLQTIRGELLSGLKEDIEDLSSNSTIDVSTNEIDEYINDNQWNIAIHNDSLEHILNKKVGNTQITVTFELQPDSYDQHSDESYNDDNHDTQNESPLEQNDADENDGSNTIPHSFIIDIKCNQQFVRVYASADSYGSLQIDTMNFNEKACIEFDSTDNTTPQYDASELKFTDLIEPVQDNLIDWFEELGIDDRLALFVQQYTYQQRTKQQIDKMNKLIQLVETVQK